MYRIKRELLGWKYKTSITHRFIPQRRVLGLFWRNIGYYSYYTLEDAIEVIEDHKAGGTFHYFNLN